MDVLALLQAGAVLVALLACLIALSQARIMRTAGDGELIRQALELLNSPNVRSARRIVYSLAEKPVSTWSQPEITAVEIVGGQSSHLGFMVKHGYVPRNAFIDAWGYRFTRTYAIIEPYLINERARLDLDQHWIYFEWLARVAYLDKEHRSPWWRAGHSWARLKEQTARLAELEGESREHEQGEPLTPGDAGSG